MFIVAMIGEFYIRHSIIAIKNAAFVTAAITHALTDDGLKVFTSCLTITSLSVYIIRYYYPTIYLTFLWRFCTMLIMVTASYNLDWNANMLHNTL